jgi:hypothetical protein
MGLKLLQGDVVKHAAMARLKPNKRREAGVQRFFPAEYAETPAVARLEPRETVIGHGGHEVISTGAAELQELLRHPGAHRVATVVILAGPAGPVPEKAGHRVGAAARERISEDVEFLTLNHGEGRAGPGWRIRIGVPPGMVDRPSAFDEESDAGISLNRDRNALGSVLRLGREAQGV